MLKNIGTFWNLFVFYCPVWVKKGLNRSMQQCIENVHYIWIECKVLQLKNNKNMIWYLEWIMHFVIKSCVEVFQSDLGLSAETRVLNYLAQISPRHQATHLKFGTLVFKFPALWFRLRTELFGIDLVYKNANWMAQKFEHQAEFFHGFLVRTSSNGLKTGPLCPVFVMIFCWSDYSLEHNELNSTTNTS